MKIQRCKGMRDLSPEEMTVFRLVEGVCRDTCSGWGYREVRTPTIEYLHLFTSAGTLTPGRLGKVYSFLDWDGWSGERVVLRPDGTIPVARLYTESYQGELARLFYAANIFIFEEAGDKTRERWQCGAELIGAGSAVAEVELITLSLEVLKKLGLKGVELQLSHAGLIKVLLEKLGLSPEEQNLMFGRILDGDAGALREVSRKSPELADTLRPFLNLKGQSSGFLRNQKALLARTVPEIRPYLDEFLETAKLLDGLGIEYQINIASGAGFEYYTGIIFQFFIGKEKVGGGGRYDALIPSMGGGDVPASGFALYLDSLVKLVSPTAVGGAVTGRVQVRVKSTDAVKEAFGAAGKLRESGYIVELDIDGKKTGADWIVEVGEKFTMVNMNTKKKKEASTVSEVLKILEAEGGD
ncbi:MAG: histidine--tRNA ligase family protein [Dehalococcoidales bacterium]|nr:histidine--tRNA ligase family protein [Dehalococcoidales bacterium]